MYDKLAGISTDTVQVHIPTKLLEGVKSAISLQISRVQQTLKDQPLDITPDPVSIQIARVQAQANLGSAVTVKDLSSIPNQHSDAPEATTTIDITPSKDNVSSSPSGESHTT